MKKVTFIKLGGSVITNKEIPMSMRTKVLRRLVGEIVKARQRKPDELFVVGHGQGSFAHVPASQYKTKDGFINDDSLFGMAVVHDSAAQLNRLVVHEFIKQGVPAISFLASSSIVTSGGQANSIYLDVFEQYIEKGLFPVTSGDVLIDKERGCVIWSTEAILSFLAREFIKKGWSVNGVVHVTDVDGVIGFGGKLIKVINSENKKDIDQYIGGAKGFDVTGGMRLKIRQSLEIASDGIRSIVISGLKDQNLYNALMNQEFVGTLIA